MGTVLRLSALATMLLTIAFVATSVLGQAPPGDSKDNVIEAIRKRADNHVEGGSPMQTQMVIDLFATNASGLSKQEIADVYEQEYLTKAKEKRKDIKLPEGLYEWLIAVSSIVAAGLIGAFHRKIGDLFTYLWECIYQRVAGTRLFRRISLGKYRDSLIEEFTNIHILFRPERPLNLSKVFVPLKMSGASNRQTVDALEAFSSSRRLMIKGPPGAGKSMLLRKVALELAESHFRRLPDANIPIVLPLHRLGGSEKSLNDHIVELLERSRFPRGTQFVRKALENGWLFLLLDGLDEVSEQGRPGIVQKIKDFIQKHRDCRYALTCRSAVYQGDFDDTLTDCFDILEFTDKEIWNFLHGWDSDLPQSKSISQLISALRDRPSIMALARNPLMLTIIVHLYCDTEYFILPHSRSEFYKESSDILLQRWQKDFNKFNPMKKRAILQDLAIWVQEKSQAQSQTQGADRRSMDNLEVERRVQEQLPTLGIQQEQVEAVLNEIVERSGLLVRIDGGSRYQFAHLTLQEFFAAEALQNDTVGLLERFQRDRTTWREVVKLWCGISGDCTSLVKGVHELDRLTAFECIADARQIDAALVASLIDDFKGELDGDGVSEATLIAFGSVASAMQGRGAAVFSFLKATLENEVALERRHAAAKALAMTNLQSAAEVLGSTLSSSSQFSAQLVRMGDLAVGALRAEAEKVNLSALDLLHQIGTPLAACILLPFLWNDDNRVAVQAAWSLGAVLQSPEVEKELGSIRLTEQQRHAPYLDWIWAPFAEDEKPDLGIIAGRIAHLLALGEDDSVPAPSPRVDQRIALPILAIFFKNELFNRKNQLTLPDDLRNSLVTSVSHIVDDKSNFFKTEARDMIPRVESGVLDVDGAHMLIHLLLREDDILKRRLIDLYTLAMSNCASALYKSLNYVTRYMLFQPLNTAQPGEWETLRHISDFDARDSWSLWITNACVAYILLSGLVVAGDTFATFIHFEWSLMSPLSIIYWCYWVLAGIASLLMCLVFITDTFPPDLDDMLDLLMFWFFILYIPFLIFGCIEYVVARLICHRSIKEDVMELMGGSSIAQTSIILIIVLILLILSHAFIPAIFFSVIATSNGLELFNVYNRVLAEAITVGVVVLAIACSQWALYKIVRSVNFFSRFPIADEQRGPAMKLHSVIRWKASGLPIPISR